MEKQSLITLESLDKTFPMADSLFYALTQVSFRLQEGEFVGLVGPSGSGKTTLLNIIGALDKASRGIVRVLGLEISQLSAKEAAALRRESMGFIFQTHGLLPVYSVYENVELPLLLIDMPASKRKKAVLETLERVGMTDKLYNKPNQLSGGQCQRVAIARVMVKRPKIVLADEPTANLDAENSHAVLQTMKQLNQELKTTFLFSTHDEKVIAYLQRKITLMDGKVVKDERL